MFAPRNPGQAHPFFGSTTLLTLAQRGFSPGGGARAVTGPASDPVPRLGLGRSSRDAANPTAAASAARWRSAAVPIPDLGALPDRALRASTPRTTAPTMRDRGSAPPGVTARKAA